MSTIAIIGAGFAGSFLALRLLKRCHLDDRILLIGKNAQLGRGIAFSTGNPDHLRDVLAGNKSALSAQPEYFVNWLKGLPEATQAGLGPDIGPASFVSRCFCGSYTQSVVGDRLWREGCDRNLLVATDEAVRLTCEGGKLLIEIAVGPRFPADVAVLALGSFPPGRWTGVFYGDPLDPKALEKLDPDAAVPLIGIGLTMADVVVSLLHRGLLPRVNKSGYPPQDRAGLEADVIGRYHRRDPAHRPEGPGERWRLAGRDRRAWPDHSAHLAGLAPCRAGAIPPASAPLVGRSSPPHGVPSLGQDRRGDRVGAVVDSSPCPHRRSQAPARGGDEGYAMNDPNNDCSHCAVVFVGVAVMVAIALGVVAIWNLLT